MNYYLLKLQFTSKLDRLLFNYKNKHIKVIICIDTLNLLSIIYTTS